MLAQHCHEGHDARTARDEQRRTVVGLVPDEVAADRASQFESVARVDLVGEIRRHLAVVAARR